MENRKIDTGFTDIANKPIFVGSTVSNPSHERIFDVFPGIVKIDSDGDFYVSCQSTINKNGGSVYSLTKSSASKILVIK